MNCNDRFVKAILADFINGKDINCASELSVCVCVCVLLASIVPLSQSTAVHPYSFNWIFNLLPELLGGILALLRLNATVFSKRQWDWSQPRQLYLCSLSSVLCVETRKPSNTTDFQWWTFYRLQIAVNVASDGARPCRFLCRVWWWGERDLMRVRT